MLEIDERVVRSRMLVAVAAERVRQSHLSSEGTAELLRSAREAIVRSQELLARAAWPFAHNR